MANIKWCESPNDGDCLADGQWDLMVAYIKHSGVVDFTIYGTEADCTDTTPVFKFGGNNDIEFDGDRAIMIDDDETYIGHGAGDNITAGEGLNNTLIGHDAGNALTTGDDNTFIGYRAGTTETTHIGNVAIGSGAFLLGSASYCIGVGQNATYRATGNGNIGIGRNTLFDVTTGTYNVAIGYLAGANTAADVDKCIFIGYEAGENNATDNRLFINDSDSAFPLIYGEFDNNIVEFGNNSDAFFLKFSHDANDSIVETPTNDRSIFLKPHGTGYVKFGAYVATPATDSTGYIIIEDAAGNTRKLMVQA